MWLRLDRGFDWLLGLLSGFRFLNSLLSLLSTAIVTSATLVAPWFLLLLLLLLLLLGFLNHDCCYIFGGQILYQLVSTLNGGLELLLVELRSIISGNYLCGKFSADAVDFREGLLFGWEVSVKEGSYLSQIFDLIGVFFP